MGVVLIGSWLLRGSGVVWSPYTPAALEQARIEGRPVIMDFTAAWCAPCREFDEITFHDPEVVKKTEKYMMIKIDLTTGDNPVFQQLVKDYDVVGVPTVVFLDSSGSERNDLRLVEFKNPVDFLKHMEKIN
jgi:thiol:disulfide interchange protein DsbD